MKGTQFFNQIDELSYNDDSSGMKGKSGGNLKEADCISLPDLPNPIAFRTWKNTIRGIISRCSDKPQKCLSYLTAIETATSWETVVIDQEFYSLEHKLAKALLVLINSSLVTDPVVQDLQRDLRQEYQLV